MLMSILMSHMKVIKIGQKYFLWTYVISKLMSLCVSLTVSIFFVNLLHEICLTNFDVNYFNVTHGNHHCVNHIVSSYVFVNLVPKPAILL